MTVITPGWELSKGQDGVISLSLRGAVTAEMIDATRGKAFSRVVLGYGLWQGLDFLRGRAIDHLVVRGEHVDWETVSTWTGLRVLVLEGTLKTPVDFSAFGELKFLDGYSDAAMDRSLPTARSLTALRLHKASVAGVDALATLPNLRAVSVVQATKLATASRALTSPGLHYAEFVRCTALVEIGDLSSCSNLAALNFERCNKLDDVREIAAAPVLREFLLDTKEVSSLRPLAKASTLERLRFDCQIADGDLSFLFEMPNLRFCLFQPHKNFNRSMNEVREHFEGRGHDQLALRKTLMRFPFPSEFSKESASVA
jgi:hypothetical protein